MRLKAAAAGWGAGRITSTAPVIPAVTIAIDGIGLAELVIHNHLLFIYAPLHFPGSPARREGERKRGQKTKMNMG
jgi:hypothetical protein